VLVEAWCGECADNCPGKMERDYFKALNEWESSADYVEGVVY
jgi:hypothetical protein